MICLAFDTVPRCSFSGVPQYLDIEEQFQSRRPQIRAPSLLPRACALESKRPWSQLHRVNSRSFGSTEDAVDLHPRAAEFLGNLGGANTSLV